MVRFLWVLSVIRISQVILMLQGSDNCLAHLGRRSFQLERNWIGKGVSAARILSGAGNDIHRIKIDEKERICITSHQRGGITVTNLFPDEVLWSLPTVC